MSTMASRLLTQPFIQAQIKENIKAPRHWPLCGEFTGEGSLPPIMVSLTFIMRSISIITEHMSDFAEGFQPIKNTARYILSSVSFHKWRHHYTMHEKRPRKNNRIDWHTQTYFDLHTPYFPVVLAKAPNCKGVYPNIAFMQIAWSSRVSC